MMKIFKEISDIKIITGLILLQLLVCLPFITSAPIGLDEPFSIFYAQQDLIDMYKMLENENNPPLHFILLHFWIKLFGISPLAVRSLSLLISLIVIPILFNFSKQLVKTPLAIFTVGLYIFSTFNHYHSLEARVYVIMLLLVLLIFKTIYDLLFLNKNFLLKLSIFNALLMYSHYLGGIVIGVELLLLVIFYKYLSLQKLKHYFFSGLLSLLFFLPVLMLLVKRLGHFTSEGTWVEKPHITELYGNIIRFFNGTVPFFVIMGLVLGLIIYNRKLVNTIKIESRHIYVFLCFGLPYLIMFIISIVIQPIFIDRYLLFTTPFLFLSLAIIIQWFSDYKLIKYSVLIALPMVVSLNYIPKTDREANNMVNYILEKEKQPHDIIICPPFYDLTFLYYYDQDLFKSYEVLNSGWGRVDSRMTIQSVYHYEDITLKHPTLFFVDAKSNLLFPENNILLNLKKQLKLIQKKEFKGGYVVYQFIQQ